MADATIRAKLELVNGGGAVSGGSGGSVFSASEERSFRLEQLKSFKRLDSITIGIGILGIAFKEIFGGLFGAGEEEVDEEVEDTDIETEAGEDIEDVSPEAIVGEDLAERQRNAQQALEDLAEAGFDTSDGLKSLGDGFQEMEDGTVNLLDSQGNLIAKFGDGISELERLQIGLTQKESSFSNDVEILGKGLASLGEVLESSKTKIEEMISSFTSGGARGGSTGFADINAIDIATIPAGTGVASIATKLFIKAFGGLYKE